MKNQVSFACEPNVRTIDIEKILLLRRVAPGTRKSTKYRRIAASISEVGIIEPLIVHPHKEVEGHFLLLDGHIRYDILVERGQTTVGCLIALDDEAYTYNHKVNRLSAIQEHFMVLTAIKNGVDEEAIARTLNVDVARIRQKRDLLVGVCPEAVELLKNQRATACTLRLIRKVKPMRQIEMAELMRASSNFSVAYAKCLLAATSTEQLVDAEQDKELEGIAPADMARMERELESISKDFKQIEDTHGKNVLNLVIVVGYLKKLLDSARVVRFLAQNYPEVLTETQKIADSRSLNEAP